MTFMSDDIREGMRVLYQAPGTSRDERVEAVVLRTPSIGKPLYQIDVNGRLVECCWFAIDNLPKKMRSAPAKGIFHHKNK